MVKQPLGGSKKTIWNYKAERNISKQDFHVACEEGDEVRERSLSIEARLDFTNLKRTLFLISFHLWLSMRKEKIPT